MANFMTVSLECRSEEVRAAFKAAFATHREFVPKPSRVTGMPDMLVLELDEHNPARTLSEVRTIMGAAPRTEVVLTSKHADPHIMLEVMRMGVKEFLPQPVQTKDVEDALVRFKTRFTTQNQHAEAKLGAVFAVLGGKAGLGTSSVALNLAMSFQQAGKGKANTVLVDMNLASNDLTLYLDVATPRGWQDASQDVSRLDPSMLQGLLARHQSGVHLLGPGGEGLDEGLAPGCALYTIDLLRSMFDYVVVDCGAKLAPATEECIELSNVVYIVTSLSVPSIRQTKRMTRLLQDRVGLGIPVEIVINRYRSRDAQLLKQAEGVLQMKASWLIPNDYISVSQSLDGGKPLFELAPRSEVVHSFMKKAAELMDWSNRKKGSIVNQPEKTESVLSRLWSGVANGVRVKAGMA
jgi:pilus assembly protein CpaE